MLVSFTVYFTNKTVMVDFLNKSGINYDTHETAFIRWFKIDIKYKDVVCDFIETHDLQDGMADEYRWLGWKNWIDGDADREARGMKHY